MKKIWHKLENSTFKWVYQDSLELPRGSESPHMNEPLEAQSVKEFIQSNNDTLIARVNGIPVSPQIKQLCGNRISTLVCSAATPNHAESLNRIETEISSICNSSEAEQFAGTENDPTLKLTPREIEKQRNEIKEGLKIYMRKVVEAIKKQAKDAKVDAANDPEKMAYVNKLNKRSLLMQVVANSVDNMDWQNKIPFENGNDALASEADKTTGIKEGTDKANTLTGLDTATIPWCGAYVKAMIEKSGEPLPNGPNWNVAETYVKQPSAAGQHVAIYCGGGQMIGGNQSNAVTKCPIPGNYRFNTVENLRNGIHADLKASGGEPQPGDIIVTSRTDGNSDPKATGPR